MCVCVVLPTKETNALARGKWHRSSAHAPHQMNPTKKQMNRTQQKSPNKRDVHTCNEHTSLCKIANEQNPTKEPLNRTQQKTQQKRCALVQRTHLVVQNSTGFQLMLPSFYKKDLPKQGKSYIPTGMYIYIARLDYTNLYTNITKAPGRGDSTHEILFLVESTQDFSNHMIIFFLNQTKDLANHKNPTKKDFCTYMQRETNTNT